MWSQCGAEIHSYAFQSDLENAESSSRDYPYLAGGKCSRVAFRRGLHFRLELAGKRLERLGCSSPLVPNYAGLLLFDEDLGSGFIQIDEGCEVGRIRIVGRSYGPVH